MRWLMVLPILMACGKGAPSKEPATSAGATSTPTPTAAPGPAEPIPAGVVAPDFEMVAHDGTTVKMSALKGKPVVLYFYPKDETPG
jgi:peroxiredoxin Q/BCP